MIIRHAEKPTNSSAGVKEDGSPSSRALNVAGWQRAGALVPFFAPGGGCHHPGIATPDLLVAAGSTRKRDGKSSASGVLSSERSIQTLLPLASRLGLEIITRYSRDQEQDVAALAMRSSGVVLIAWRNEGIPLIGSAICPECPSRWTGGFDAVWVFDLESDGATGKRYRFSLVYQDLLAGDRAGQG